MEKDNRSYLETNPQKLRNDALEVLKIAKEQEKQKLKSGKKFQRVNNRTIILS